MFDFVNRFKVVTLGTRMTKQKIITLKKTTEEEFWDATKAVKKLIDDYTKSIEFLRISFDNFLENGNQGERYRAFYPEIFNKTGAQDMVDKFGDWFSYDKTPRSKIIDRDHFEIKDLDSFMRLMRYNDFKNDPFAQIRGCGPEPNSAGSLANRLDLNDPKVKCDFSEHDHMVGHWG